MLEAVGVHLSLGATRALDGVTLALRPGEALGLIGPNGAGKSTLLACLSGALAPDGGAIRLDGEDPARLAPGAKAISVRAPPATMTRSGGFASAKAAASPARVPTRAASKSDRRRVTGSLPSPPGREARARPVVRPRRTGRSLSPRYIREKERAHVRRHEPLPRGHTIAPKPPTTPHPRPTLSVSHDQRVGRGCGVVGGSSALILTRINCVQRAPTKAGSGCSPVSDLAPKQCQ